jgi:hypothetical protein
MNAEVETKVTEVSPNAIQVRGMPVKAESVIEAYCR